MAKKKDSILPIIALGGIGLVAIYALSGGDTTDTGGWSGGTGTRSLTPIVTETTETTIPIGGGGYPQIVLPSIPPYEQPALPKWLFTPPAPVVTAAPPPTATTTPTTKKTTVEAFGAGGGFGGGGAGGRGGDSGAVPLAGSWVGPITGITVYGPTGSKTYPVSMTGGSTTAGAGGSGIPAEAIQSFFAAGKDYGAPAYSAPAPGGGTTYYYESGAYQTVKQGQIVSAGSAGSTTPPARYSGQYYAAPGTAAGGEKGRVYSKKAAKMAGLI